MQSSAGDVVKAGRGGAPTRRGRKRNGRGYIVVWQPDHPHANSRGYVPDRVLARRMSRPGGLAGLVTRSLS